MAQNSLAPGYVVLHYSVLFGSNLHTHKQTLPVNPLTVYAAGANPEFHTNGGDPIGFQAAIDAYAAELVGFFSTGTTLLLAEYWQKPTENDDPLFIKSVVPSPAVGTGGSAVSAGQVTISFRSELGGIFKFTLMESEVAATALDTYPFSAGDAADMAAYLTGDDGWVWARDGGVLISAIKLVGKTNDKLRRKYILNG